LAPEAPAIGAPACEAANAPDTAKRDAIRVAMSLFMVVLGWLEYVLENGRR
jgi:hypothetical protein